MRASQIGCPENVKRLSLNFPQTKALSFTTLVQAQLSKTMSLVTFFNITDSAPTWIYFVVVAGILLLLIFLLIYIRLFIWKRGRGTSEENPTIELSTFPHTTIGTSIAFATPSTDSITAETQLGHGDRFCWTLLFKPRQRP